MTRLEFFPYPFLAGLGLLFVVSLIQWRRNRSIPRSIFSSLFGLYLLILVGLTLFPMPIFSNSERHPLSHIVSFINLVPFRYKLASDLYPRVILREIVGNILLTIPFGFGISFIHPRPARYTLKWLLGIGFLIELSQLAASLVIGAVYRGVDIDDVILNGLGALIGYGLFLLTAWIFIMVKRHWGIKPWASSAYLDLVIQKSGLYKNR